MHTHSFTFYSIFHKNFIYFYDKWLSIHCNFNLIFLPVSSPPPTIVVSTDSGVTLKDEDTGEETNLLSGQAVSVLAFVANEETIFYIEQNSDDIYKSNFEGDDSENVSRTLQP